jgi:predicted alpha/beta-fold hydrolase
MRRESQYIDSYLATTEDPATRYTPDTYLAYTLHGKAKDYSSHYVRALMAAISRRVAAGTVVPARSAHGSTAYVRRTP